MAKPETYFLYTPKPRRLVCRIHRPTKKGTYYLLKPLQRRRGQHEYVGQISLSGFTSLPSGLKRDGTGLPSSGYLLLKNLSEKLGRFRLTLDSRAKSFLENNRIVLNHDDLRTLLRKTRTIRAERFREISDTVQSFLHSDFPSTFEKPEKALDADYRPNTIADALKRRQTLTKLSKDDIAAVGNFFPEFIQRYGAVGSGKKRLFILSGSKRATEVVYVRKIIADFERRLGTKAQSEQSWQDFLRDYILLFNSNYATVLEKENIAILGTRFPDFILIDAYNYLDIYEIKKPTTNLLKKDESRGNYYWDVELTKAISQVENYISHADRNAGQLCGAKRPNDSSSMGMPVARSRAPITRKGVKPKNGAWTCHREIHHGTSPATIPGGKQQKNRCSQNGQHAPNSVIYFPSMFSGHLNVQLSLLHSGKNMAVSPSGKRPEGFAMPLPKLSDAQIAWVVQQVAA